MPRRIIDRINRGTEENRMGERTDGVLWTDSRLADVMNYEPFVRYENRDCQHGTIARARLG